MTSMLWVAGFLEGEGSFMFLSNGRGYRTMTICATSTDLDVLERLVAVAGGAIKRKKDRPAPRKPCWEWRLRNAAQCKALAHTLLGLGMGNRRQEQIVTMLTRYDTYKETT